MLSSLLFACSVGARAGGRPTSIQAATRKLAFLGDALEHLAAALDAIEQLAAFSRKLPHDLVLQPRHRHAAPGGGEIDQLADLVSVLCQVRRLLCWRSDRRRSGPRTSPPEG